MFDDYPIETLNKKKLPKVDSVVGFLTRNQISSFEIVDRITDFYKRWKALKQDSERKERATTQNFVNKVSAFKDEVNKPMNVLVKDWRENLKKAGIKDFKQDIQHVENQMKEEQIGSLGSIDTHQIKKDKRKDKETASKEKAEAKSAAEKDYLDKNLDLEVSPTQAFSLTKLQRKHLWYLTPELVTLSLFDQHVPAEVIII